MNNAPREGECVPMDNPEEKLSAAKGQKNPITYAAKKKVAQGMMDIALITANANQLRYIIEYTSESKTYYCNLVLVSLSLILQIAIGLALIFKGKYEFLGKSKVKRPKKKNNFVVGGVFLVTIINIFIASFTITENNTAIPTADSGNGGTMLLAQG